MATKVLTTSVNLYLPEASRFKTCQLEVIIPYLDQISGPAYTYSAPANGGWFFFQGCGSQVLMRLVVMFMTADLGKRYRLRCRAKCDMERSAGASFERERELITDDSFRLQGRPFLRVKPVGDHDTDICSGPHSPIHRHKY